MAALLTSALSSSQIIFPIKTEVNGVPAITISESQMDSINVTYLRLKLKQSVISSLQIQINIAQIEIEKSVAEIEFLNGKTQTLNNIISTQNERYDNVVAQKDLEIDYYKKKARKLTKYFLGFSVGVIFTASFFALFSYI